MAGIGAYDPRQQAHISLTYKNDPYSNAASKSFEVSQLHASVRSTAHTPSGRTREPAASSPYFSRQLTEAESTVHPPFLDRNCRWNQQGLPTLVAQSQGQSLTSTGRLDGTRGVPQAPCAISAVHSYNDTSPVLTAEYARDTDRTEATWDATINKRGTAGVFVPAGPTPASHLDTLVDSLRPLTTKAMPSANAFGDMESRRKNVDAFWQRNGATTHLKQQDAARIGDEVGTHAVPGTGNSRLVAGKWRYIPRPTEGKHLYTDYYGRFDDKPCDYFGRTYHYLNQ